MAGLRATALYYWLHQLGVMMAPNGLDRYLNYFQEIFHLIKDIMDFEGKQRANENRECMETGIILPLSLVIGGCRHYPTQRKAFSLLLGAQKKEGIMESKPLALVVNQKHQNDPEWWKQTDVCFKPGHIDGTTGNRPHEAADLSREDLQLAAGAEIWGTGAAGH